MFDHVEFSVSDIAAARDFYGAVIDAIGAREMFFDAAGKAVGYGIDEIVHLLLTEGTAVAPTVHICFQAPNKLAVDTAHAAALAAGGKDNGAPGYRKGYGPGYYAAFMYDRDGHNVEVLYREQIR